MEGDKFIEALGFNITEGTECDYCTEPKEGIYAKGYDDDWMIICGKCIVNNQKTNNGKFNEFNLPAIILPF